MAHTKLQPVSAELWVLVRRQHGVVTRTQLLANGIGGDAIQRRISAGRLHPLWRGVYAVGRPEVSRLGRWMGAVLSCGPNALLSHSSAAALWQIMPWDGGIDVVVPGHVSRRRLGIRVHRRAAAGSENGRQVEGIPVTDPTSTLVDLAERGPIEAVEEAVREADRLGLIDPVALRGSLDSIPRQPGLGRLRKLLDSETFSSTDSVLERRFLRLVRTTGLPLPQTQVWLSGYRVDFYWPELGLVVETDGLTYHRTPSQQKRDRQRDQTHAAAGLTPLRFTAAQVHYESEQVVATLRAVMARLRSAR